MRLKTTLVAASALWLATTAAHAQTVVTVASFPDLDRAVKAAIPLYKKVKPNVEIKLTSLAYPDHHTAMTTALATGANLPDVMAVDFDFIGKFAESGGLEDLGKAPYNALQHRAKLSKFSVPQGTSSTGALAGVPTDIGPGALFYRKDLIEKAGISEADLTRSWESYIEAGKKVKAATGGRGADVILDMVKAATGAYMLGNAVDIQAIYIRSGLKDGEGIYFDAKGSPLVTTPRFVKAFELAKSARVAGIDGKINAWSNEWSEGFKRDKIASQMMGAWLAGHLNNWLAPDQKGKWRSAQLPGGAYASWGGSFYAIPKKAQQKKEAWDFIQFLTLNKDMQIEAFRKLDAFPALLEAQNDSFLNEPIEYLGGQTARQQWKQAADQIKAAAVNKLDPIAREVVNAELEKVLEQGKDVKTALADAQAQITRRVRR